MTEHPEGRPNARTTYVRSWLRHGANAVRLLGWSLVAVSAILAAMAEVGDRPGYLIPAVLGLPLIALSVWLAAEADR